MPSPASIRHWSAVIAMNLLVAIVLVAGAEMGSRYYEKQDKHPIKEMTLQFHPYIMFTSAFPEKLRVEWHSPYVTQIFPSTIRPNNLGFLNDFDFTYTPDAHYLAMHGKKPGEKIVLFTGGSAAQGVGASSNDHTIAYRMEHYLNAAQSKVHYRVINLGMASWISYQEYIALDLFGSQFNPDWVVAMDGSNDAAAVCQLASGAANPMFWPTMYYFLNGQSLHASWKDALVQHSAFVRLITGKHYFKPPDPTQYYRSSNETDMRLYIKARNTWSSVKDQVGFYLRTEQSILRMYQDAKYILSTQPTVNFPYDALYYDYFATDDPKLRMEARQALEQRIDALAAGRKDEICEERHNQSTHSYFLSKSSFGLEAMARDAQARHWRDVRYKNIITLLPKDRKERERYFMDLVHMNDEGQDLVGKFYAKQILERDGFTAQAGAL